MSANAIFFPRIAGRIVTAALLVIAGQFLFFSHLAGDDTEAAEMAVARLVHPLEKSGFDFRSDVWERELKADIGKAVSLQLFKGNEYRICIAVGENSGAKLEAHLLDSNGDKVESDVDNRGWGVVLTARPKHTGVYVVTIIRSGGKQKELMCAMIMGYK